MGSTTQKLRSVEDPIVRELKYIRNLLVVLLVKLGSSSDELDVALGMGPGNLRAMFRFGKIKKTPLKP